MKKKSFCSTEANQLHWYHSTLYSIASKTHQRDMVEYDNDKLSNVIADKHHRMHRFREQNKNLGNSAKIANL